MTFWLLLRQTLTERQEKQTDDSTGLSDVHVEDQMKTQGKHYDQQCYSTATGDLGGPERLLKKEKKNTFIQGKFLEFGCMIRHWKPVTDMV